MGRTGPGSRRHRQAKQLPRIASSVLKLSSGNVRHYSPFDTGRLLKVPGVSCGALFWRPFGGPRRIVTIDGQDRRVAALQMLQDAYRDRCFGNVGCCARYTCKVVLSGRLVYMISVDSNNREPQPTNLGSEDLETRPFAEFSCDCLHGIGLQTSAGVE